MVVPELLEPLGEEPAIAVLERRFGCGEVFL